MTAQQTVRTRTYLTYCTTCTSDSQQGNVPTNVRCAPDSNTQIRTISPDRLSFHSRYKGKMHQTKSNFPEKANIRQNYQSLVRDGFFSSMPNSSTPESSSGT